MQSNSQRQVAAAAAKLGLDCHLAVYHGRLAPPTPEYERTGNAFLNRLFGATLHDVPWTGDRNGAIAALADRLRAAGQATFLVPYGVSNPLGAVGYASTVAGDRRAVARARLRAAAIVHCSGSAGTQAGLVVGAARLPARTRVVGIDIDAEPERVRADVIAYGSAAAELLDPAVRRGRCRGRRRPCRSCLWRAASGDDRGDPARRAPGGVGAGSGLFRQGPGRADRADPRRTLAGRRDVVFIHTGGAPALFAYPHLFDPE